MTHSRPRAHYVCSKEHDNTLPLALLYTYLLIFPSLLHPLSLGSPKYAQYFSSSRQILNSTAHESIDIHHPKPQKTPPRQVSLLLNK